MFRAMGQSNLANPPKVNSAVREQMASVYGAMETSRKDGSIAPYVVVVRDRRGEAG